MYWFCLISKWIWSRYTCVPHPEPSSLLPSQPSLPGCHRTLDLNSLHHAVNFHWLSNFTYGNVYVSVLLSQFTLPHHHVQKCPRTSYFQPRFILGNMPYDMDHKQCASYLSSNPLSLIAWFLTSYLVPLNLDFLLKTGMIVFAFQDHLRAYDVRFTMCLVLCLLLLLLSHFSRVRLRATTQMAAHQA